MNETDTELVWLGITRYSFLYGCIAFVFDTVHFERNMKERGGFTSRGCGMPECGEFGVYVLDDGD